MLRPRRRRHPRLRPPASAGPLLAACGCFLCFLGGCVPAPTPRTYYDLTLHNATDAPVSAATVRFDGYDLAEVVGGARAVAGDSSVGDLRPGERATHYDVEAPVPDRLQVLWTDAHGRPQERTLDLAGRLPPNFGLHDPKNWPDEDFALRVEIRADNELELLVTPGPPAPADAPEDEKSP